MTKRESILQAIKTILDGISGPTGVYRSRVTAFTRAESPALLLIFLQDTPNHVALPIIDWTMRVRVSIIQRGDVPDSGADDLVQDVHSALVGDLTLGGLAMDLQPASVDLQLMEADQEAGIINLDFNVLYRTELADISA